MGDRELILESLGLGAAPSAINQPPVVELDPTRDLDRLWGNFTAALALVGGEGHEEAELERPSQSTATG